MYSIRSCDVGLGTRLGSELEDDEGDDEYIWPKGELSLKARVVFAIVLLVGAKVAGWVGAKAGGGGGGGGGGINIKLSPMLPGTSPSS